MLLLYTFAFLSGLVTILAPCIWPLLPIILSSSIAGSGHRRPLGITLGIMLSFSVATLTISSLVRVFNFDPNSLRLFAVVVIGLLGLAMMIPKFGIYLEVAVSRLTSRFGGQRQNANGGQFSAGFVTGLSLGLVWAPCAGPIFASIAALTATGKVTSSVILLTLAYVLGLGIPLFIFAYGGQRIFTASRKLNKYTGRIQQVFGLVMILTALAIYTNYDKVLQVKLLNAFPGFSTQLNRFESNDAVTDQLKKLKGQDGVKTIDTAGLFNANQAAPQLSLDNNWLNPATPLTLESLKGKVVLIDFWTYTCINCVRTLPHVTAWYDKYKDNGLVVLGIHTPEFEFEKKTSNVEAAIKQFNIHYPVAQDNNYSTWNNFENQYWPAEYLIDKEGNIRRVHFGEGGYDEMEQAIRTLLGLEGVVSSSGDSESMPRSATPEIYFGLSRLQYLSSPERADLGVRSFTYPATVPSNTFALEGKWNLTDERAMSVGPAKIKLNFSASNVYMVAKSAAPVKLRIIVDGTFDREITVSADNLYTLFESKEYKNRLLEIEIEGAGLEAFTFTFG